MDSLTPLRVLCGLKAKERKKTVFRIAEAILFSMSPFFSKWFLFRLSKFYSFHRIIGAIAKKGCIVEAKMEGSSKLRLSGVSDVWLASAFICGSKTVF